MALFTVQTIARTGLQPVYTALSTSDTFYLRPGSRVFLHIKNGSGATRTTTVAPPIDTVPGRAGYKVPTISASVIAGAEQKIGPITDFYSDANGIVTVTRASGASMTMAVVEIP